MQILKITMNTICTIVFFGSFYMLMVIGSAVENDIRCENGAVEFCTEAK